MKVLNTFMLFLFLAVPTFARGNEKALAAEIERLKTENADLRSMILSLNPNNAAVIAGYLEQRKDERIKEENRASYERNMRLYEIMALTSLSKPTYYRPPVQTHCTADLFGNVNCLSY